MATSFSSTSHIGLLVFGILSFVSSWWHFREVVIRSLITLPALNGWVRADEGRQLWKRWLVLPTLCVLVTAIVAVSASLYSRDEAPRAVQQLPLGGVHLHCRSASRSPSTHTT